MICEGQRVPHTHKDDACEYRYLECHLIKNTMTAFLCSRCVALDRSRGYALERTFSEEEQCIV